MWEQYMETLLKSKYFQQFTKTMILNSRVEHDKFIINRKKDDAIGFMMTYISKEICIHIIKIDCLNLFQNKLKFLFNKIEKNHFMQIEKEFISLNYLSFDRIKDYLAQAKEIYLKLVVCGEDKFKKRMVSLWN